MPSMEEIRQQYPQYDDMPDADLAKALHGKYYSDMPFDEFAAKIGFGRTWADVPGEALQNAPGSAMQFGRDLVQPIIHPLETGKSLVNLAIGANDKFRNWIDPDPQTPDKQVNPLNPEAMAAADAFGQALKYRYGGMENIKRTLATDPVGSSVDVLSVLAGGAGLARSIGARSAGMIAPRQLARRLDVPKRSAINVARDLPDDAATRAADMGTDAMLANLDPNLEGQAGRIASMDVAGAKTLRSVAEQQRARAGQRAEDVMDRSLGQAADRFTEKLGNRAVQKSQSPIYEIAKGRLVDPKSIRWAITEAIENDVRGSPQFKELRGIMKIPERDPISGRFKDLTTDAGRLITARQRIDEMIRAEGTTQGNLGYSAYDKGKQTVLGVKLMKLRGAINQTLHTDKELAKADKVFADSATRTEAFDLGYNGAAGSMQPDELAYRMANLPAQAQAEVVRGYRAKVDDVAGSIRPNRNEGATLLTQFNTPNQLEKQKILAGLQAADDIARAGKSERNIAGSATRIIGNSETARRQEFAKLYPSPNQGMPGASLAGYVGGGLGYSVGDISGAVLGAAAGKALEGAANMIVSARRANIANGAARLLSMTGGNRDAAIQALTAIKARNLQPFAVRNADLIIRTLMATQASQAAGSIQYPHR